MYTRYTRVNIKSKYYLNKSKHNDFLIQYIYKYHLDLYISFEIVTVSSQYRSVNWMQTVLSQIMENVKAC